MDRNNQSDRYLHAPRLNKLVTEVAPVEMHHSGMALIRINMGQMGFKLCRQDSLS
ncbi:S6 family peptidase [Escherichia albertii]|uniref:S6 family peptidase n=1 Tax=Escherichia albertii TaxID=208962 RepID=UPI003F73FD91